MFLSLQEQEALTQFCTELDGKRKDKKFAVTWMYPKLRAVFQEIFGEEFDLFNSENVAWLPQFINSTDRSTNLKPDMFVGPKCIVTYEDPYSGYVEIPGSAILFVASV
jgi:hypothetical protein